MIFTGTKSIKLYPNKEQKQKLAELFELSRTAFNDCLRQFVSERENRVTSATFTAAEMLCSHNNDSIEYAITKKSCDFAYQSSQALGKNLPHFHSKTYPVQSFSVSAKGGLVTISKNHMTIRGLGRIKCRYSQKALEKIRSYFLLTIDCDLYTDTYTASLSGFSIDSDTLPKTKKAVGIDVGIRTLATIYDGTMLHAFNLPWKFSDAKIVLDDLFAKVEQLPKDSKEYKDVQRKIAKLNVKLTAKREHYLHLLSSWLIHHYDYIYIEDLDVREIADKNNFHNRMTNASIAKFFSMLEYKAKRYDKQIIRIRAFFPSSQLCSSCGYIYSQAHDLSVRNWICPCCQAKHDRDENAAKNIYAEGMRIISQ